MREYRLILLKRKLQYKQKLDGLYESFFIQHFFNKFVRNGLSCKVEYFGYTAFRFLKFALHFYVGDLLFEIAEKTRSRVGIKIYRRHKSRFVRPYLLRSQLPQNDRYLARKLVARLQPYKLSSSPLIPHPLVVVFFDFFAILQSGSIEFLEERRLIHKLAYRYRRFVHFRW